MLNAHYTFKSTKKKMNTTFLFFYLAHRPPITNMKMQNMDLF